MMRDHDRELHLERQEVKQGPMWGTFEWAPKGCREKNLLGGLKGKKVTGDELTQHSDWRVGNHTRQQVRKAIPCYAKI